MIDYREVISLTAGYASNQGPNVAGTDVLQNLPDLVFWNNIYRNQVEGEIAVAVVLYDIWILLQGAKLPTDLSLVASLIVRGDPISQSPLSLYSSGNSFVLMEMVGRDQLYSPFLISPADTVSLEVGGVVQSSGAWHMNINGPVGGHGPEYTTSTITILGERNP